MSKFKMGQVVMTQTVNTILAQDEEFSKEVTIALARFADADWGEMEHEDIISNNEALESGDLRLFASYETTQGKIWIICEADRSVTTILFPSDY